MVLGEWQVIGNYQYLGVVECSSGFVEFVCGGCIGWGVQVWDDVQNFVFVFEGSQGFVFKVVGNQVEIGGGGVDFGQVVSDGNGIVVKSYGGYISFFVGLGCLLWVEQVKLIVGCGQIVWVEL